MVHQRQNEFLHKPVIGTWILPPVLTKVPIINDIVWTYLKPDDGAWDIAQDLRSILLNATASSDTTSSDSTSITVVYIHCMRGIDRTGLVAGTYLARYGSNHNTVIQRDVGTAGKTIQRSEIQELNYNIGKRDINW